MENLYKVFNFCYIFFEIDMKYMSKQIHSGDY